MLLIYILGVLYWYVSTMEMYIFHREGGADLLFSDRAFMFLIFAMFGWIMYPMSLFRKN
jgi:hypothetical protein